MPRPKTAHVHEYFKPAPRLPEGKTDRVECLYCGKTTSDNIHRKQNHLKVCAEFIKNNPRLPQQLVNSGAPVSPYITQPAGSAGNAVAGQAILPRTLAPQPMAAAVAVSRFPGVALVTGAASGLSLIHI